MRGVEQNPALYDRVVQPLDAGRLGTWRRRSFASLTGDILELGVGTGLNLSAYGPRARVIGVDVDTVPEDVSCAAALATWQALNPDTALPTFDFTDGRWHIQYT